MSEINPILPHGGKLVNLFPPESQRENLIEESARFPSIIIGERQISDFELLSTGAYSPLEGFMGEDDYLSVLENNRLESGLIWTIPVTLSLTPHQVEITKMAEMVYLKDSEGNLLGLVEVEAIFKCDKEKEAVSVYKTTDLNHPGVRILKEAGDWLLAGRVICLSLPEHRDFLKYRLSPDETRREFNERGWKTVVGFQTRNPIHRAHEYIQKCALEMVDGLLLHPLVGQTKADDLPADVRMKCYEAILDKYYPPGRAIMAVFPAAMRYAGPREAIFHAIIRKNYGCTHFIVGRDHAGIGNYYGSYDAQYIFRAFNPIEIGITPMFFDYTFYCVDCGGMASSKTCPHNSESRVYFSGTKVRDMLKAGEELPSEFTRPEVAEVLKSHYRN